MTKIQLILQLNDLLKKMEAHENSAPPFPPHMDALRVAITACSMADDDLISTAVKVTL